RSRCFWSSNLEPGADSDERIVVAREARVSERVAEVGVQKFPPAAAQEIGIHLASEGEKDDVRPLREGTAARLAKRVDVQREVPREPSRKPHAEVARVALFAAQVR